jgi:uncharacterized protein (TIGR03083 family)
VADLDHLALLESQVAEMASALAASDPDAPVVACPGWTVRDLAGHVTTLHGWVTDALDRTDMPPFAEQPAAGGAQEIAAAYAAVGEAMTRRMRALPPDHACWTFDPTRQVASFWYRRQMHELAVHRWDLDPHEMDEPIAADGVDEALDFFLPRMLKAGRATLPGGTLELVSPTRTWTVGSGEPVARAEGSAGELLLALWGRNALLPQNWRDAKLMP